MKNILALPEKISTKLPKIHTFPYRSSEFDTIHYLKKLKVEFHTFSGIPYRMLTLLYSGIVITFTTNKKCEQLKNKLKLNPDKTEFLLIGIKFHCKNFPIYILDNSLSPHTNPQKSGCHIRLRFQLYPSNQLQCKELYNHICTSLNTFANS